ncbi:carboxypeptidase-like regulatory domain-containing protein [Halosquirtibacter xylanolyticus]|uniref:TonB-dependent receptor n=1 Tax=Halosquirtibacter xylanolyticus TaxID=3374599 RepID=UPI003748F3EF|nr:carboxypeptidase-like regulatory domain-containing protein [Prolixibacteraceae bacterium]
MKRNFVLVALLLLVQYVGAVANTEKGVVKGAVYEIVNQQKVGLAFVNVYIEGTSFGAVSDMNGNFQLPLAPGTYDLVFSSIGYRVVKQPIDVSDQGVVDVEATLEIAGEELDAVLVVGVANRETEQMLLVDQKKSSVAQQSVGAKELSRKAVSNVMDGVAKVTGISKANAGNITVRGLGDRYNATTLNGLPIASPNPDTKMVPLDLFPTTIVKNIGVQKVFMSSEYADFSGGNIDIKTKDFVSKPFLDLSLSVGGNSNVTFKDIYLGDTEGNRWSGFGVEKRELPEDVKDNSSRYPTYTQDPFNTSFDVDKYKAIPSLSLGVSGGKTWDLHHQKKLGVLFSVKYGNDFSYQNGRSVNLDNSGNPFSDFNYDQYAYETMFSGLGSINFAFNNQNKIYYNMLMIHRTQDQFRQDVGYDSENNDVLSNTSLFRAHQLMNHQLMGDHQLNDQLALNWKGSYSIAKSSEPDRKNNVYQVQDDGTYTLFSLNQQETMRYFGDMNETDYSGAVELSYMLKDQEEEKVGEIKAGVDAVNKDRDFSSYKYYYNVKQVDDIPVDPNHSSSIINDQAFADGDISLQNGTLPRDAYDAGMYVVAGYINFMYHVNEKFLFDIGVRAEKSNQYVNYYTDAGIPKKSVIDGLDLFPTLNLKFSPNEKSNWRLGLSRTITRPDFIEMAPFQYRESYGGTTVRGNADIQNGYNYNFDLKWELFPNRGELVSFGVYGKYLDNPIERTQFYSAGVGETFQNADKGVAAGAEFEIKKRVKDFTFGLNASYIYTQVYLPKNGTYTQDKRALQGASPYLINADISYPIKFGDEKELRLNGIYNVYGKRIYSVGVNGAGDIYQMPLNTLDFLAQLKLNKKFSMEFSAKNLLNPNVEFQQDLLNENSEKVGVKTTNSYPLGVNFSFGIKYHF